MKDLVDERAVMLGQYIVEKDSTVRETAKAFSVSKSTVHKDVTQRLSTINPALAKEVKAVLQKNKAERHMRGGEATRLKYEMLSQKTKTRNG
ncbi:MAG: sporulation transcriptional regulator SpoIIID [Clostridia bacterium]|nr:sporulation transcriptional regulator SpoIIID [Clostridia bacterium]